MLPYQLGISFAIILFWQKFFISPRDTHFVWTEGEGFGNNTLSWKSLVAIRIKCTALF